MMALISLSILNRHFHFQTCTPAKKGLLYSLFITLLEKNYKTKDERIR
jgi:hypothetical protein